MKILLRQPLAFSEIGLKDNQEDTLYPNPFTVKEDQCVFLMCDGMGGHDHGEVASQAVATSMGRYFENQAYFASDSTLDPKSIFESALQEAYDTLDAIDTFDSGKKMGTTMTCLYLSSKGALMAHIGDSRIYHIRPSLNDASTGRKGIRNVTSDHSLVNDLLKAGELTPEEAQSYPHKNIITRAIQPHQERRAKADINVETDIMPGDYFFLCCDGVLEQLTDSRLCEILAMSIPDKDKLALIKAESDGKTKDNYTAWLIPVENVIFDDVTISDQFPDDVIQAISEEDRDLQKIDTKSSVFPSDENIGEKKRTMEKNCSSFPAFCRVYKKIFMGLGIIGLLILGFWVTSKYIIHRNDANEVDEPASSFINSIMTTENEAIDDSNFSTILDTIQQKVDSLSTDFEN